MKFAILFYLFALSIFLAVFGWIGNDIRKNFFYTPFKAGQCIKQKDLDTWETDVYLVSAVGKHSYFVSECDEYLCHNPRKSIRLSLTNTYEQVECPDYSLK